MRTLVIDGQGAAVGACDAEKVLIPVGKCSVYVAGTESVNLAAAVEDTMRAVEKIIAEDRREK